MSNYSFVCDFGLEYCLKTIGLVEMGRVQKVGTEYFKKNVQSFVPFDEAGIYENPGRLVESCHTENGTDVVWDTPYARRLYYHPEYSFQGAPMRGGYWADRYVQNGGREQIEQVARAEVKK